MYDVTSRTIITKSTTGPNVGPSTYVICNPRCQKQSCVPFLSSKEKESSFVQKSAVDALYNIRDCSTKILGGASPRSKAPRFVYKSEDTPGPADYNAKPICCRKKKVKLDPNKPKLYACSVPYSVTVVPPSIPSKSDENGYEILEDGNIVKIPQHMPDPIPIDIKSQFCGKKGYKWSSSRTKRFDSERFSTHGPGPAAYTIKIPKSRRSEEDERCRERARKSAFMPRYVELQEILAARENKPGPGAYNVDKVCCKRKKPKKPPPFIVGSARFPSAPPQPLSPNSLPSDCKCEFPSDTKKIHFRKKCVPFGVQASRFKRDKLESSPGPGSYDVKGAIQEKIEKKKNPHALCDPPFNSTINRSLSFVPKDSLFMPSSADYPEDKGIEDNTVDISSAVFVNNVCRFFAPSDKKDHVGPAKYQDCKSFEKTRDRKSFNVAEVPFSFSGIRSTTPAVKFGVPCPTTYKNGKELSSKSYYFALSPRFPCEVQTPGPGSYKGAYSNRMLGIDIFNFPEFATKILAVMKIILSEKLYNRIHPRIETSTYTAFDTHNLRLKENVLHKRLRQAPRETRKRWLKTMRKKKLLKWFDIELDYEQRMIMLIQQVFDKPD